MSLWFCCTHCSLMVRMLSVCCVSKSIQLKKMLWTNFRLRSWWNCLLSAIVVLLSFSQGTASFHDSHLSSSTTDGAYRKRPNARPACDAATVLARCIYGLCD